MTRYAWLPLRVVDKFDPLMRQQGVSKVARGVQPSNQTKEGFLEAYRVVKGSSGKMKNRYTGYGDEVWSQRRSHFIGRHLKQMERDKNSSGWTKDGMPTRRHLGLIAWAYSPTLTRTKAWVQKNPAKEKEMSRTYSLGTTILHSGPSNDLLEAIIKDQTIGYESFGTGIPVDPRLYGPQYVGQRRSWTPKQLESVHLTLRVWKQQEKWHFREFVERDDYSWDDSQKMASAAKHTKLLNEAIDITDPTFRSAKEPFTLIWSGTEQGAVPEGREDLRYPTKHWTYQRERGGYGFNQYGDLKEEPRKHLLDRIKKDIERLKPSGSWGYDEFLLLDAQGNDVSSLIEIRPKITYREDVDKWVVGNRQNPRFRKGQDMEFEMRNPTYSFVVESESKYKGGPTSIDIEFIGMALDTVRRRRKSETVISFTFRYRAVSERGIESQGTWTVEESVEDLKRGLEYLFSSIADQLSLKVGAITGMSMTVRPVLRKKLEGYLGRLFMENEDFAIALNNIVQPIRNPRFRKGQRVKEKGRKGTVVALHTPGTADILFDDMDFEIRRPIKKIQNPAKSKWSYGGTEQWKGRTVHLVMYYDGIKKRYYTKDKAHRYLKDRWAEEMGRRPR